MAPAGSSARGGGGTCATVTVATATSAAAQSMRYERRTAARRRGRDRTTGRHDFMAGSGNGLRCIGIRNTRANLRRTA